MNMLKLTIALLCLCTLCGCKSKEIKQDTSTDPVAEKQPDAAQAKQAAASAAAQPQLPKDAEVPEVGQDKNPKDDAGIQQNAAKDEEDEEDEDYAIPQDGTIEEKMASLKWESDVVGRFDFDYEAPAFMKEMPAPANNDGSTYRWKDMAFKVWGAVDMYDGSAQKAFESSVEFLGHAPHYKLVKANSYIMSDYTKDGLIFYKKCVYKFEYEFCEQLEYPKDYKEVVEPMVKKVAAFDVTRHPDIIIFNGF